MSREKEIKGNVLIYCIFQISNICLAILGLFTFMISIYLMVLSKSLNFMNLIFFFFGLALCVLAYLGCKLRNMPFGNLIYSVTLSIIFIMDLITTLILFTDKNIVDEIMKAYKLTPESENDIKKFVSKNILIINDLLLTIVIVLFCVVVFSWLYRRSLLANQADWNKSLIEDNVIEDFLKRKTRELKSII